MAIWTCGTKCCTASLANSEWIVTAGALPPGLISYQVSSFVEMV